MTTAEYPSLTLAFLQGRPQTAARAFNDLDPGDAAAFLATIPGRLAGPIVGYMAPHLAARCIAELVPERAAGVVRGMAYLDAVSVLRLVAAARFEEILEQLPRRLARDLRHSLTYPKRTVGAHMDPSVPALAEDDRVAEALKTAQRPGSRIASHVFVVGAARRLAGAVAVVDLLRSDPNAALSEIMDRSVRPLSNRARLANVAALADWDDHPVLPVVGRKKNLLGGLSRKELRRELAAAPTDPAAPAQRSLLSQLVGAYAVIFTGLLRLILQREPRAPSPGGRS